MILGGLIVFMLAAPRAADVEHALERVRSADRYQTELPGAAAPTAPEPSRRSSGRDREPQPRDTSRHDPADLRPVGKVLFWLMVAAVGIAAAVWIGREIRTKWRARMAVAAATTTAPPPVAATAAPLLPHEELARRGEYVEAIHAILVAVLAAIGRARSGLRPSWTSREILGLVKLGEEPRRALASLVRLVEVTRFGGAPATEDEYRLALGWLDALRTRRAA